MSRINKKIILILILLVVSCSLVFSEDTSNNLSIGVVLIENPKVDADIEILCNTVSETVELTLRLLNKYTVTRLDFLAPEADLLRAKLFFDSKNFDNVIFGQIDSDSEGSYRLLLSAWDRQSNSITVQTEYTAVSVVDMMDVIDNLAAEFIEKLTGEQIGFGKVFFTNEGLKANYNIYVDGNFLGKNLTESSILFGERTIKITTPGRFGDTVVETAVINIEENGEEKILFSMNHVDEKISIIDTEKNVALGNLFINSFPENSEVFMDNQSIGFTPLSLYGVGSGLYDLRLDMDYYMSSSQVLRLDPNVDNTLSFNMDIDVENPDIQKQMKNPARTGLLAAGLSLGQIALIIADQNLLDNLGAYINGDPRNIVYLDYLILTPRYGHLLAGDELTGTVLSLASLFFITGLSGVYDSIFEGSNVPASQRATNICGFSLAGLILYDMIFSPLAGNKQNKKLLDKFKTEGVSFEQVEKDILRYVVQTGGGGLLYGGVAWAPFGNWLSFEQLAGISLNEYSDILKSVLSLTTKINMYPFSNEFKLFRPYIGALFNVSTDISSANFSFGLDSGFDIDLNYFDIFFEANLYTEKSFGGISSIFAAGVRL